MKSRGHNRPCCGQYIGMRAVLHVVIFVLAHHSFSALAFVPSATSWNINIPVQPTTVGELSSSVTLGRLTYLFGGIATTQPFNMTLRQFIDGGATSSATAINYVDTLQGNVGTPVTLPADLFPPPWTNISSNITNNASSWQAAVLPFPSVGENNAVVIGSSIYSLAMCNVIPAGVRVNVSSNDDLDFFRSGWVVSVVTDAAGNPTNMTPSGNHSAPPPSNHSNQRPTLWSVPYPGVPRVQVQKFDLEKSLSPRLNASCVAHGTNIYIVGGVQLSAAGSPSLTTSVAVFDTVHHRFSDSVWSHDEAVANCGVTSDDTFVYIVGGQLANNGDSFGVFAHHIPSNVRVSEPDYPEPVYSFPFVAVTNGLIAISGSPYSSIATWSMRLKNGFPVANPNSAPSIIGGTLTATPTSQNITLALFGGITPNAGSNSAYYESTLTFGSSMWDPASVQPASFSLELLGLRYFENATTTVSPDWIPNNNGNITASVEGYTVLWANFTFSVLFDNTSLSTLCNISAGAETSAGGYCTVRIARSLRCDDPYVTDVIVNPSSVQLVTLPNNRTVLAVGPFSAITQLPSPPDGPGSDSSSSSSSSGSATPPPIMLDHDGMSEMAASGSSGLTYAPPVYASVCFSTSPYQVPNCVSSPAADQFASTDCIAHFYTPLTTAQQTGPFMVYSSEAIRPAPPPAVPPSPGPTPTSTRLGLYAAIGGAILLLLGVLGVVIYRRNREAVEWGDYDDDDGQDETTKSFLSDKHRRSSSRSSPQKNDTQQAGLLDGKYRFVHRLGKGSFSVVYLVERVFDGQRFALKYVQIADDTDRHEAMKECEVVHRLQGHPNVIHLYDMFMSYRFDTNLIEGGTSPNGNTSINGSNRGKSQSPKYFDTTNFGVRIDDDTQVQRSGSNRQVTGERFLSLVMEYHERGDLGKWAKKQKGDPRVPEATVLSIAFQVLSVLNYMHGSNPPIIHRDLKPENILLSSVVYENMSNSFLPIVVTDFGLSRVMDKTFCETGVGSLPYVAPECWQRCYSTKVDIWAVGCILYAVCAKRVEPDNVKVMFSESARPDFYKKLFHELNTVYGYSEGCSKFIITLLDVDATHRPTAAEALKRMKRRRAASATSPINPGMLRKELSELDSAGGDAVKSYGSEEMSKDAQCEFYIPHDTSFGVLSNGWNLNAPPTYGTNDLPLGMVTSGPLPHMPTRVAHSTSIGPAAGASSRSLQSSGQQQAAHAELHREGSTTTTSSGVGHIVSSGGASHSAAHVDQPSTEHPVVVEQNLGIVSDDASVHSMKKLTDEHSQ